MMGRTVETSETDSSGMKQLQRSNRNKWIGLGVQCSK